jgi:hypothetical protein
MALSPDEKFIYVNPDTGAGQFRLSKYYPVRYLRGLECTTAGAAKLYFRGPLDTNSTQVTISITSGYIKEFFIEFLDEINFGENSVIVLSDRNIAVDATTGGTDFQHVNAYSAALTTSDSLTAGFEDVQITEDLDIGGDTVMSGSLTLDSVALSAVQTSAESFVDNDTSVMTSAAIDDRINTAVATTVGSAVDLTSEVSGTLPVANGGTGLTTVAANTILTGNNTAALTAEANLSFTNNRLTVGDNGEDIQPYLRIMNDENSLELGISNAADDFVTGSADGDIVFNSFGDHNILFGQNDVLAAKIDTDGDFNLNRKFTVTGDTDGTYEGDVVYFGGTTSMTVGRIYHYKSDGTWEGADADAVATSDGLLAVALGAASDTNGMLLRGMVTLDHDPGAVGDVLYLSTTIGQATATAPSGNNDIVRVIGYCLDASNGQIWFNPDNTFVEVTA